MKTLGKRRDIAIIATAEKGAAVVIMDNRHEKKLIANYLIKTITKYFKRAQLYNTVKW